MAEIPNVHLSLPNSAENVLVVRQALSGVAAVLALDAIETNDVNTAVTEACNNVVMHAYGGGDGPLEVDVYALRQLLTVVVRDRGRGIRPPEPDHEHERAGEGEGEGELERAGAHTGMGIPVIEALSRRVEFTEPTDGGTRVRMEFDAPTAPALAPIDGDDGDDDDDDDGRASAPDGRDPLPGAIELQLAPNAIARAVLPRVLSALAARAYFSTDRIADVQLIADVLAANAEDSIGASQLDVGVRIAPRNLELRVGPPHTDETFELSLVDRRGEGD
jgi:serine/threonine-protein kinase RsbW